MADEIDPGLNIAEEIAGWRVCYPDAYADTRERWLEFIHNPSADTDEYVDTIADQIEIIDGMENVPNGDAPAVISASFLGATADTQLGQQRDRVTKSAGEIKKAVHEHID